MESNVTPNITRLLGSFSPVAPIVNRVTGDALCVDWDYHSLGLAPIHFHSPRSHHSLTLPRSRFRDSTTVTLTAGDGTTATKVESSA